MPGPRRLHPHEFSLGPMNQRRPDDCPFEPAGANVLLGAVLGLVVVAGGLRADSLLDFGQSLYQLITKGNVKE